VRGGLRECVPNIKIKLKKQITLKEIITITIYSKYNTTINKEYCLILK